MVLANLPGYYRYSCFFNKWQSYCERALFSVNNHLMTILAQIASCYYEKNLSSQLQMDSLWVWQPITRNRCCFLSGSYLCHYGVWNRRWLLKSVGVPRPISDWYAAFRVAFVTRSLTCIVCFWFCSRLFPLRLPRARKKRKGNRKIYLCQCFLIDFSMFVCVCVCVYAIWAFKTSMDKESKNARNGI